MPEIRIALAQIDTTVGDLSGNARLVVQWTARAAAAGADLVAFPEMTLTGYPPEDLVLRGAFVRASRRAVTDLAARLAEEGLGETVAVVGFLDDDSPAEPVARGPWDDSSHPDEPGQERAGRRNAVAVLHRGAVVARACKHHLPNYGVFDEYRYFAPGRDLVVLDLRGVTVGLAICEDAWRRPGPFGAAAAAAVDAMLVVNGSPYERHKDDVRLALCRRRAAETGAAVAYVNLVGGQDELVFDGDSLVVGRDGAVLARATQFAEELLVVDLPGGTDRGGGGGRVRVPDVGVPDVGVPDGGVPDGGVPDGAVVDGMTVRRVPLALVPRSGHAPPAGGTAPRLGDEAAVWGALVTGTRAYVRKSGFRSVIVGLSGGIDSALTATVAADALGPEQVHVVGMPSPWSSEHSVADARDLAERRGLRWRLLPIGGLLAAFQEAYACDGLALENLQARIRGQLLMTISNQEGHLVLAPGNKSELATGFSTLYGDSAGGFAPLKDVPKSLVWRLAAWRNAAAAAAGEVPPVPEHTIAKPPSAELAPGQLDSDRLPAYEILDAVVAGYVDADAGRAELVAAGLPEADVDRVIRLVDLAEYKRRQYPPGPKISGKAFGRDRRLPLVNRWRDTLEP